MKCQRLWIMEDFIDIRFPRAISKLLMNWMIHVWTKAEPTLYWVETKPWYMWVHACPRWQIQHVQCQCWKSYSYWCVPSLTNQTLEDLFQLTSCSTKTLAMFWQKKDYLDRQSQDKNCDWWTCPESPRQSCSQRGWKVLSGSWMFHSQKNWSSPNPSRWSLTLSPSLVMYPRPEQEGWLYGIHTPTSNYKNAYIKERSTVKRHNWIGTQLHIDQWFRVRKQNSP